LGTHTKQPVHSEEERAVSILRATYEFFWPEEAIIHAQHIGSLVPVISASKDLCLRATQENMPVNPRL